MERSYGVDQNGATKEIAITPMLERIAGAPISWGVDGSPGWGFLMDRDRVLDEMRRTGLAATELGPDGYLPVDPEELGPLLDRYGLGLVGGFVPLLLYRPESIEATKEYAARAAATLAAAGSGILVVGPSSIHAGYDTSVELDPDEWSLLMDNLGWVDRTCTEQGVTAALHPHWGMAVERAAHVERFLEGCHMGMCLDTGHLYLAGVDPVEIARMAGKRTVHVHLKDVHPEMADQVRSGDLGFRQAVINGMFVPLGRGGVDIAGVVRHLESIGYQGWYVLEQDKALSAPPGPDGGPIEDANASMAFLEALQV